MPRPARPDATWLSLHEASRRLDVNPATLREWANRGRIRTFRTPGGHRRFSEEDVRAMGAQASPDYSLFMNATVGHARLATTAGRLASESWYARFDEVAKDNQRRLGMDLMRLLVAYLADPEKDWMPEISPIGDQYATLAKGAGLSLSDAMRAFHVFEDLVRSSVDQVAATRMVGIQDLERHAGWFLNEVRVAMVESFNEEG